MEKMKVYFEEKIIELKQLKEDYDLTRTQESTLEFLVKQAESFISGEKEARDTDIAIFDAQFNDLVCADNVD